MMAFKNQSVFYLIGINIAVFILANHLGIIPLDWFALFYPENERFAFWQVITYLFLHGSFAHLLFNMFALFSFGVALESLWGTKRFLIFYFISGVGAAAIYTLVNYYQFSVIYDQLFEWGLSGREIQNVLNSGTINREVINSISETQLMEFYSIFHTPAVGASGAIYGILIAYAITYPNAKLALIFLPIPISAKYFVPIVIGLDLFFGLTSYSMGNIAHFAHIGGALFGLLMMLWWKRGSTPYR